MEESSQTPNLMGGGRRWESQLTPGDSGFQCRCQAQLMEPLQSYWGRLRHPGTT